MKINPLVSRRLLLATLFDKPYCHILFVDENELFLDVIIDHNNSWNVDGFPTGAIRVLRMKHYSSCYCNHELGY